jgi:peptidoglycan-associated lipoprotein
MKSHALRSRLLIAAPIMIAVVLGGCASKVKLDDKPPVESRQPGTGGGAAQPPQSQVATVDLGEAEAKEYAGLPRVVYFDFDSFAIRDEFRPTVDKFGKALAKDSKKRLTVEGHTDERGGREYNLALGQKRAESVTKSLVLLGAADSQLEAVSFGKERPAAQGSDEAAWAKNRRAELKDR